MSKHYAEEINLYVDDVGYGVFYFPDLGYDLEKMGDDIEDFDYSEVWEIENDTAARLSQSYNLLLNVPEVILFSPAFRKWIETAAERFFEDVTSEILAKKDMEEEEWNF